MGRRKGIEGGLLILRLRMRGALTLLRGCWLESMVVVSNDQAEPNGSHACELIESNRPIAALGMSIRVASGLFWSASISFTDSCSTFNTGCSRAMRCFEGIVRGIPIALVSVSQIDYHAVVIRAFDDGNTEPTLTHVSLDAAKA